MFKIQLVKPDFSWSIVSDCIEDTTEDEAYGHIEDILSNKRAYLQFLVNKQVTFVYSEIIKQCIVKFVKEEKE